MRQIIGRCLLMAAFMAAFATPSKGMMSGEHRDSGTMTAGNHCCDFRVREKESMTLADNTSGVFIWNDMYCYLIPDSACSGGDCEPVRMCCTDADNDGFFERCGDRRGDICRDGTEAVTAYCKK